MSDDEAQRVRVRATRAKIDGEVRYVCDLCGCPVYAPKDKNGRPLWAHRKGAPDDCPWWTGIPGDVDSVSASQFQGAQESALHLKIKAVIAELLELDGRTEPGSVVVDRYLSTEDGRRRPDVRAIYSSINTVFEVQLATTQIPIILGREAFYQKAQYRLLWMIWNFQPPEVGQRLRTSFNDIFHEHAKCLFSMDAETIERSRSERAIFVRAFWTDRNSWVSQVLRLSELGWLPSGRATLPTNMWASRFLQRWLEVTDEVGTPIEHRIPMLDHLAKRLELDDCDGQGLDNEDICSLINCLLSIREGRPIGSRQPNLVSLFNTFLNVDRRHRFASIVRRLAITYEQEGVLQVKSVQKKLQVAGQSKQDGQRSLAGRVALALFPEILPDQDN